MSAGPARGSVHDRAGVVPVEDPGDAAHAEPATDAEGQVPDQGVVEVVGQSFEEGVVAGGDVGLDDLLAVDPTVVVDVLMRRTCQTSPATARGSAEGCAQTEGRPRNPGVHWCPRQDSNLRPAE